MRCPYCGRTFTLTGPYCPSCGRRLIGREEEETPPAGAPGQPPASSSLPPAPSEGEDILVVELEDSPPFPVPPPPAAPPSSPAPQAAPSLLRPQPVTEGYVGSLCPYCRFPLKYHETMVVCPACKVAHHADCWNENRGCTTYGCAYSPEAHPPQPAAQPGPAPASAPAQYGPQALPPPLAAATAAQLESTASAALLLSILGLFCCGLLSVLAILMAVGVLVRMRALGLNAPRARQQAIAAIIIGLVIVALAALFFFLLAAARYNI
jgi:uncharacterized Zn finger protein (UPF0148 family)